MEPVSLLVAACVIGLCLMFSVSILWWALKTAVRAAIKIVVLAIAAVVVLGAIAAVAALVALT